MTEIKLKVCEGSLTQVWVRDILYVPISERDAVKADLARVLRENKDTREALNSLRRMVADTNIYDLKKDNDEFREANIKLVEENAELKSFVSKLQEIDTKLGGFTKHWNDHDWSMYTELLIQVDDVRENYGELADKYNEKVRENAGLRILNDQITKENTKDLEILFGDLTTDQLGNYMAILLSRLITRLKQKEEAKNETRRL